ncbi:MAG: GGDEF domain-containing protein [Burkholderiales bacterium]
MQLSERFGATPVAHGDANVDPLTGLYSDRLLADIAESRLSEARRHGYQASVVKARIDDFAALADSYGRSTGDAVMRSAADLLRTCLRREDVVGRTGDGAFVVLMMHCDSENAFAKADALRDALAQMEPEGVPVTASFGVASAAVRPPIDFEMMITWAGDALNEAQRAGANRTIVHRLSESEARVRVA